MIKARIRWCSCRVENTLTLGKLLRLWFCFLLHSILFFISQNLLSYIQNNFSYELARPIMGTIFLVYIHTYRISLNRSRTLINSRPRIGRLVALLLNLLTRAPRIGRALPPVVQSRPHLHMYPTLFVKLLMPNSNLSVLGFVSKLFDVLLYKTSI